MIFDYLDLHIDVEYNYKPQNKRAYIKIKDNKLIINSFKKYNEADVKKIINTYYAYIKKKIKLSEKKENSNSIHLFGKEYPFKIIEEVYDEVRIFDETLCIYTRNVNYKYVKKLIDNFYIEMLKYYMENHFNNIYLLYSDVVLIKPSLKYKTLKSCYGKYDKRDNSITFSSSLAKYEYRFIDLVIAHELTHYKYMNHQESFYNLLESKMPGAKRIQHMLRKTIYNDYF